VVWPRRLTCSDAVAKLVRYACYWRSLLHDCYTVGWGVTGDGGLHTAMAGSTSAASSGTRSTRRRPLVVRRVPGWGREMREMGHAVFS
jgi:hypothetical protein